MNWRAWIAAVCCGWGSAWALTVQDDLGRTLELAQPPQRIVSILPSLTETICELEQCHRLVGVDRYSTWPASLQRLPRVGGGLDPNIEAIVALRPDLVLAASSTRAVERLASLGIPVLAFEPKTHADVQRVVDRIGQVLGIPDAQRLWRQIDAGVKAAAQSLPEHVRTTRVYFEVNRGPYGAGESSFMGETLARLGVHNILPARLGPFPKVNPEWVVRANPDVILMGERPLAELAQRPGWSGIRAIREGRVCVFTAAEGDVLVRAGPRMAEAARLMARCLADQSPKQGSGPLPAGAKP